ncbi:hypothetical protein C7S14_0557 [Burkholderia cepacia]|nr:hypothetical protein C7S14_0557 [Burkholderia cepacia]
MTETISKYRMPGTTVPRVKYTISLMPASDNLSKALHYHNRRNYSDITLSKRPSNFI